MVTTLFNKVLDESEKCVFFLKKKLKELFDQLKENNFKFLNSWNSVTP